MQREEAGEAGDLRRRLRAEQISKVLDRAAPMPAADRLLLESVFRDGRTAVQVGALLRVPARSVRRRVKGLVKRLASPEYIFVLRERDAWATGRRRVADACVVRGLSMNQAAAELRLSFHGVRRQMEIIAGLFEVQHTGVRWNIPAGSRRELVERRSASGAATRVSGQVSRGAA